MQPSVQKEPRAVTFSAAAAQPLACTHSIDVIKERTKPCTENSPRALVFPEKSPAPAYPPAEPSAAFPAYTHPLMAPVLLASLKQAGVCESDSPILIKIIEKILPVTTVALENYAQLILSKNHENTLDVSNLSIRYSQLKVTECFEDILLQSGYSSKNYLSTVLHKLLPRNPPSSQERLKAIRAQQTTLLDAIRVKRPSLLDNAKRLRLYSAVLNGLVDVTKPTAYADITSRIERRKQILLTAETQANLALAQLTALEEVIAVQMSDCDRLLSVTLSAVQLNDAIQPLFQR